MLHSSLNEPINTYNSENTRTFDRCECIVRDFLCKGCNQMLGYNVVNPCMPCYTGGNNGHFYMYLNCTRTKKITGDVSNE